jgi:transcriptional regulator with GAF, ATPase, and Fis domain
MKTKLHMLLEKFKASKDKKEKDLLRYQIEGEVTRILSSTIDQYSEHLKDIVKTVSVLMQSERVSLMVRKKNFLEISASHGLPEHALQRKSLIRLGQGIAGKVAQTGEPIFTGDLTRDEGLKESSIGGQGFKSNAFICLPLKSDDGKVLGVINVSNPTEGSTFRKMDFNFLVKTAELIGVMLHKSMQLESMRQKTGLKGRIPTPAIPMKAYTPPEKTGQRSVEIKRGVRPKIKFKSKPPPAAPTDAPSSKPKPPPPPPPRKK